MDDLAGRAGWADHVDVLAQWKQGHLVSGLPLTWIAPPGVDPVTGLDLTEDSAGPVWAEESFDAIICSQTCDIGATPPGDQHPTVLVAPLVHESGLSSNSRRKLAADGKLGYLVQVLPADKTARQNLLAAATSQTVADPPSDPNPEPLALRGVRATPRGHRWFADLRLLVPISKGMLLDRQPLDGFTSEAESLAFGEILAQKFRRPATHEALSEALPEMLKSFIQSSAGGANRQCFAKVEQVRLWILDGDRLNPQRAQLLVLTDKGALDQGEQDQWAGLNQKASELFRQHDIDYAPLVHWDVNAMPASVYRQTVPIRCPLLGHTRWP